MERNRKPVWTQRKETSLKMITLHGFPVSNYYNIIKIALLEKDLAFSEQLVLPHKDKGYYEHSKLGKVPFITTEKGAISESVAILEYLERLKPNLYPQDAFAAAKVHEINMYLKLHMELVSRDFYGAAFFGQAMPTQDEKDKHEKKLVKGIKAFMALAKFSPYVAGESFTAADIAAFIHLPLISICSKAIFEKDLLNECGLDWKPYVKMIGERPSAKSVMADRKAYSEAQKK